jgi:hypothetical protein
LASPVLPATRDSNLTKTVFFRKAVRAAIVLQPLLGITNSLQMVAAPYNTDVVYFAIWSYGTTLLVSFQVTILSAFTLAEKFPENFGTRYVEVCTTVRLKFRHK